MHVDVYVHVRCPLFFPQYRVTLWVLVQTISKQLTIHSGSPYIAMYVYLAESFVTRVSWWLSLSRPLWSAVIATLSLGSTRAVWSTCKFLFCSSSCTHTFIFEFHCSWRKYKKNYQLHIHSLRTYNWLPSSLSSYHSCCVGVTMYLLYTMFLLLVLGSLCMCDPHVHVHTGVFSIIVSLPSSGPHFKTTCLCGELLSCIIVHVGLHALCHV